MASHTRSASSNFSFCFSSKRCSIWTFFLSFLFLLPVVFSFTCTLLRLGKRSTATTLVSIGGFNTVVWISIGSRKR
ncbi:unnamed protein product [Tuber melanosporum]|uniref:(Perigord truffle) hypothetical protein n=1 Tax=Tuber melanosporum (strain Mel28) TaxID=656061 RepID=D5G4Q9_TUBMM|nr:uncharacterized protein GSTUM_00000057001 [Tuber melanosporum]CAZ79495.1 unnamed protein product [Tuber melanosporum]